MGDVFLVFRHFSVNISSVFLRCDNRFVLPTHSIRSLKLLIVLLLHLTSEKVKCKI